LAGYHEQDIQTAPDVGNCQRPFAHALDKNKEHEPGGDGNKVLEHDEDRQVQNLQDGFEFHFFEFEKPVQLHVGTVNGVPDQVKQGNCFGNDRRDSGTFNAQFWKPEITKNQQIIKDNIGYSHENGRCGQNPRLGYSHVQPAKDNADKREEKTVDPPVEVGQRGFIYVFGAYERFHNIRNPFDRKGKNNDAYQEIEEESVVENWANEGVVFFAVAPADQNLRTLAKPETNHVDGKVKHSANGRCTQFYFAYATEKCRVGNVDNVLCNKRKEDGIGYFEYVSIGSHLSCIIIVEGLVFRFAKVIKFHVPDMGSLSAYKKAMSAAGLICKHITSGLWVVNLFLVLYLFFVTGIYLKPSNHMKKSILFIVFATIVLATLVLAQKSTLPLSKRWEKVNELAEKQLPESALKEVETILKQARDEKNAVEVIKAMVYKMRFTLEKNPGEAPALIKEFEAFAEKSTDPAERALLHSMTAELYQRFYQSDAWTINQRTEVKGFIPEDMKEWTRNIYFEKIASHLKASLENPSVLQTTDALKFGSLFEKGEDSRTLQPTLFDFLASRKIQLLQQLSQATTIKNPLDDAACLSDITSFITYKPDTAYNASVENQVVQTYQQLLSFRLTANNVPALLYADMKRLDYVRNRTENSGSDSIYLSTLTRLEKQYSGNGAVVEVLAEKANYYLSKEPDKEANRKTAYDICSDGLKRFPGYKRINILKNIQLRITQKSININYAGVIKPASTLKVGVRSANVRMLQLMVFRVNATAEQYYSYKQTNRNRKKAYANRTLLATRDIEVKADPNFDAVNTDVEIKTGDYGIYEFSLQEKGDSVNSEQAVGQFTVTDLVYMTRTTEANLGSLYVLDGQSGQPQKEAGVEVYTKSWNNNGYKIELSKQLYTDKNGLCQFPFSVNSSNNVFFFSKGKDRYLSSESYSYFNQQIATENDNASINLFTDRSLYRPGQTVYFKGIACYSNKNKQSTVDKGTEYEVTLYDVNGQKVSAKNLKTNEFGSFAGEFVLPQGGLNGAYRLQSGQFSQNIWVEEYKRPTFEVKMDKPGSEINFGEKVTLMGRVKAYAGYPVGDARVKYRVIRRPHRFCWWLSEPDKEIVNGTTTSKADGTFEVSFIPAKTKSETTAYRDGQIYTYTLYADVTDTKGETQMGEQSFSVGDKSLFILAEVPGKINNKEKQAIEVITQTINDEVVNSTVKYTVSKLAETEVYAEKLNESVELKEIGQVLSGSFDTKNKKLELDFDKLVSGRYKLILTSHDSHGREVKTEKTFVLYDLNDKRPPVKSYVWLLSPKTVCEVGGKAQVIFGTSTANSFVLYEIMQGNTVLESRWIPFSNELKLFDIPFKESYGAGVTVMFTFMKDGQLYKNSVQLMRKLQSKKLSPALSVFRDKLQPGEKAEWVVTIPESAVSKRPTELLVGMYDASLDAIRPHYWDFDPTYREVVAYSPEWNSGEGVDNSSSAYFKTRFAVVDEFKFNQLDWFGLNMFNAAPVRIRGMSSRMNSMKIADNEKLNEAVVVGYGMQKKESVTGSVRQLASQEVIEAPLAFKDQGEFAKTPVQIRSNFNETAFFYPQLRTDAAGNVKFTFTAPESLTRWNVKMLAHTQDLYFGQGEAQAVTQKDLMVQMNLPRFVRRSDKLMLGANVINLTDKPLTANVQFEMIDPATEKPIKLKDAASKALTLAAKETKAVEWELTEFSPYELVICKVVARAANFSDGEQKYLPVLPDKVLLTESMPLTVRGNQIRTFSFGNLLKNGSKVDTKSLSVEFSSNPAWYAVQALPTLAVPENSNAIDYFTAYYVNSLAAFMANSNPKLAAMFDRWKKAGGSREALLSNLEKNSELKNMLLEETPWVMAAKDESEQKRQIALLFDLNNQKQQNTQYLDKLLKLQLPSGAFTWFEGMSESRYITQEILLNFARLGKMTHTDLLATYRLPLTAALNYLDLEIARDFDNLKRYNKNYEKEMCIGNMQLFYLHLRSEYPTVPVQVSAQAAVRFYTAQSEKYWTSFSLYGKAMMAVVAQRNGKIQLANDMLKSLKENAIKTDELGMYWAKNTPGYFWNERPMAVQAAIIEAFTEISGNVADVDEMKIWLLKQKQTQRWDSPMATVEAIYALLHHGTDWLANEGNAEIKVGNTTLKPESAEAGTGYFKQSVPVADIRPAMGTVTVKKNDSGIGWGAMYWQYYQDLDKVSGQSGPLKIDKKLFVEKMSATGKTMIPIEQTQLVKGDKVITRLVITTDRNLEFVALKDLRASCFEPVDQRSGCQWKERVCYYQTTKDASTQFFFSYLPKGTYVFEYELWANAAGEYTSGIASLQCQYAPEFVSHTGGERIRVK
jgi:Large extracellular alpha-helical protein